MSPRPGHHREQGVALVTALLVVAIAATASAAIGVRQQVEIHRSAYHLHAGQLTQHLLAAESIAKLVLARDRQTSDTDHAGEMWAQPQQTPLDGGIVSGRIEDLQGRLNVNGMTGKQVMKLPLTLRFQRLLQELELPTRLAAAIVDWIDADQAATAKGGAEDMDYLGGEHPYRSAGRPLVSPTELRLISGMNTDHYRKLEPQVTTLPTATALNVNTASPQLLKSLFKDLEQHHVDALVAERDATPFTTVKQFLDRVATLQGREKNDLPAEGLTVASNYFLFSGEAHFGDSRGHLYSLLQRDAEGHVQVLRRSREGF